MVVVVVGIAGEVAFAGVVQISSIEVVVALHSVISREREEVSVQSRSIVVLRGLLGSIGVVVSTHHAVLSVLDSLRIKVLLINHGGERLKVGSVKPPVVLLVAADSGASKAVADADTCDERPVSETEAGFTTRFKLGEIVNEPLVWHDGNTTLVVLGTTPNKHS